ncbi:uncharacterized protein JCM10292_004824 [Rhodotorula paludigena]|uniref:uncharacterized protein n=1 Tax=Rhodotorula paludigena TaxID=86838 RepID=UPI0031737A6A
MVSFSCGNCGDTMKKNRLDQHAQRCRGAYFECIDCNTTFEGTSYRAHTSCVSEEQRYHKSVYKAPKGKGQKAQQQQQQKQQNAPAPAAAPSTPSTPAPAPAPASAPAPESAPQKEEKKRAREDDAAPAGPAKEEVAAAVPAADGDEPAKKKKKKSKKGKKDGEEAAENGKKAAPEQKNGSEAERPSVKGFLEEAVAPLLAGESVSLADVREKVVEQAKAKGFEVAEVEKALWAGLKVGGKKQKVRAEFA